MAFVQAASIYYKQLEALPHSSYLKRDIRFKLTYSAKYLYIPSVIITFSVELAKKAALEDDVKTNRLIDCCFEAASSIFRIPFVTLGMTSSGLGFREVSVAYIKKSTSISIVT